MIDLLWTIVKINIAYPHVAIMTMIGCIAVIAAVGLTWLACNRGGHNV